MKTTATISAGEFKAKCLQLLDDVAATGEPLTITKRGKPVARLVPVPAARPLYGAMKGTARSQSDLVAPTDESWEREC